MGFLEVIIILVFLLGYLGITMEHTLKIDKLIPALTMMAVLWAIVAVFDMPVFEVNPELKQLEPTTLNSALLHHIGSTAEILVFLIGAMTIVELIDYFDGFSTIKGFIKTKSKVKLLWIVSILSFCLSAIIDNLTATIVLITILSKLISDRQLRLWFAGIIIIAANSGGAWSPIGDVTTTMLWIAQKVTPLELGKHLFIPSVVSLVIPLLIVSRMKIFKGNVDASDEDDDKPASSHGTTMFYLGLSMIIFVPIFKTITNLPPYMGMMLSLSVVAVAAEIFSHKRIKITEPGVDTEGQHNIVHKGLRGIEMPSILFFLGILMAVAAMEALGMLFNFAGWLTENVPSIGTEISANDTSDLVVILLGMISAVIDNVPLVAASIGMFSEVGDDPLWHMIAYAAGTGGSMLIIGSAAGVVAMGMEKINFFWYLKKITPLAALGYFAGIIAFILIRMIL